MTIEKALEILQVYKYQGYYNFGLDELEALQLGIEALKREEHCRQLVPDLTPDLLPGETKED